MLSAQVKKRFSVAMAASAAGHIALLLGLLWYVGKGLEPAESSWVLDVRIATDAPEKATLTDARSEAPTAKHHPLGPPRAPAEDEPAPGPTLAANPAPVVQLPEPSRTDAGQQRPSGALAEIASAEDLAAASQAAMERSPAPESSELAELDMVALPADSARGLSLRKVPPAAVAARRPLLPHQSKMLERKFRQWTEKFHQTDAPVSELSWRHKGQAYSARFRRHEATGDTDIETVTVEIHTEQDGVKLSTQMHMKRLAFSNFAQFVNRWDPRVQVHRDELAGRFHSNSKIVLAYDRNVIPTFHGKVTTAARQVNFADSRGYARRDKIFRGGLETGVRRISLPRRSLPFLKDAESGDAQVKVFEHDTEITFHEDGTIGWRTSGSEEAEQFLEASPMPAYLIGAPGKELRVKGVVSQSVLVYSPERITITDDLIYAHGSGKIPGEGSGNDAFLGLVSDKYVDVAPAEVTGGGDLTVHAAIYAGRGFAVRDYRAKEYATLHLFGSLSAGTVSATEPRFSTSIEYDVRLEERRPPGFPTTDRYEVTAWDGEWTEALLTAQN